MASRGAYLVPSLVRAMRVLEFLASLKGGASVSEVSRNLALPKSSTCLILNTLKSQGYLQRSVLTGKFTFAAKFVDLSQKIVEYLNLCEVAKPFLTSLMRRTGIVVHLAVLEGNHAVLIDRVGLPGMSGGGDWIGHRLDINCTGVGKALAAFLSNEEFNQKIRIERFSRHNENTIVTIRRLKQELARVREQGYALDDEEDEVGMRGIGVPIFNNYQRPIAAISLAGTTEKITGDRILTLASALKQTASGISRRLSALGGGIP